MNELIFGPAGVPLSSKTRSTPDGIVQVKKLGLGAMEMEFVQGVRMGLDTAAKVNEIRKKHEIVLTAHGPYYINLNAQEEAKLVSSRNHILSTARVAQACGAYSITFHPAFYLKMDKQIVFDKVKHEMKAIMKTLKEEGVSVWVRPETTGKATQFGDIDELIKLSQDVDGVLPCVDFSHLHARSGGAYNTLAEFRQVLGKIEKGLGREALNNMHIHLSGINYTDKGERNHLILKESDMNYKDLIKVWREFKIKGVVISESPNLEEDAMLMKNEFLRG